MKKLVRSLFVGAALAMPLVLLGTSPAAAVDANVAVISGSGIISPGLDIVPVQQSISFTGTATYVGTDGVLATAPCAFAGTDLRGSIAEGAGTVSGGCTPYNFSLCAFVRVFGVVVVVCANASVPPLTLGAGVCVFTPDQVLPTTSYQLVCAAVVGEAP